MRSKLRTKTKRVAPIRSSTVTKGGDGASLDQQDQLVAQRAQRCGSMTGKGLATSQLQRPRAAQAGIDVEWSSLANLAARLQRDRQPACRPVTCPAA